MSTSQSRREEEEIPSTSRTATAVKCLLAGVFFVAAIVAYAEHGASTVEDASAASSIDRRRLSMVVGDTIPTYMENLFKDLRERKKLFDETPPEEVKYWFEYTGPLQVRGAQAIQR